MALGDIGSAVAAATAGGAGQTGYWGEINAMHQFCEEKYATHPLFAEFWNSVSNVPFFILPGIYCSWRGGRRYDFRIHAMWWLMVCVGVGSFMFHMTMRYEWELLDEMPMVLLVLGGVFSKDDSCWLTTGWRKRAVHAVSLGTAICGMGLYVHGGAYDVFVALFTALVVMDVAVAFAASWAPDRHGSFVSFGCLVAYAICMGLGRTLWELEVNSCPAGSGGQLWVLHVFWHALAGGACYYGILADAHCRYAGTGIGAAIDEPGSEWPMLWPVRRWLRSSGAGLDMGKKAAGGKAD